jgi:hypothetical protein
MVAEHPFAISQVHAEARGACRCGRRSNSPPQFGQTCFICAEQPVQNVHSYEQMYDSASMSSTRPHFRTRLSFPVPYRSLPVLRLPSKIGRLIQSQILTLLFKATFRKPTEPA